MKEAYVMDTNVAIVANGLETTQAGPDCIQACIDRLLEIRGRHRLVVDETGWILGEYSRRLSHAGQPGVGDAFFKWLWDNQANPDHCRQVWITATDSEGKGFAEFPDDDPALATFDRSDRKFVAVALASDERPPILNAADTDWWHHQKALARQGVQIQFLCPELMREAR